MLVFGFKVYKKQTIYFTDYIFGSKSNTSGRPYYLNRYFYKPNTVIKENESYHY